MKLAFVTTMNTASWGGSEALWAETVRCALDSHHEVFVSVYDWPDAHGSIREFERRGAHVQRRRIGRWWRRSALLNRLFNPFDQLRAFKPDAVLVSQGGTYDIARRAEMKALKEVLVSAYQLPYVLLCHCEQIFPSRRRSQARAREAFRAATIVGMLSSNLRARAEKELGVPLSNVRFFQNPLNVAKFSVVPWPEGASLRMAFVGRLEPIKGLHKLIGILGKLKWLDRDWRLSVMGDGDQRAELETQARRLGIQSRIEFRGFVDNIDAVWREHHLLVLPSAQEGVPNSMLEAMLSGRAVVVTDVGGIREWVCDGQTGFIAEDSSSASIEAALERAWVQRECLKNMGEVAHIQTLAQRDADPAKTLLGWLEEIAYKVSGDTLNSSRKLKVG